MRIKKGIALGLILLLFSLTLAPSINTGIGKTIGPTVKNTQIIHGAISREKMIEIAEAYASYEWYPTLDNIAPRTPLYSLIHSVIHTLIQNHTILSFLAWIFDIKWIDTPDRDTHTDWNESIGWKANQMNIGVPYQWGGFSSISGFNLTNPEDFYEQYMGLGSFEGKIHYAGDIFCETLFDSRKACGVDCSGFVSRCWNLSQKQSTRTLSDINFSLPITFDELQMGDILLCYNSHVMLFHEFVDDNKTQISVYEAGPCYKVAAWKYDVINISQDRHSIELKNKGIFELYSYNVRTIT